MRVAVISDIHANLEALEKAIETIEQHSVDDIVCLGDVVGYGANPNECIQRIRELTDHVLLGNHDDAAIHLDKTEYFNPYARIAAEWTHDMLTEPHREFLAGLPYSLEIDGLMFVHSSPYEPSEWHYILNSADARMNFGYFGTKLCFVGHSHVPGVFSDRSDSEEVTAGARYLINVGSIGQPRDGDPRLSFGLFDSSVYRYENIRVEYDVLTAAAKIKKVGLPRPLADRLIVGR